MPNYLNELPLVASGNISPMSIVASDSSGDFLVRQATAGDTVPLGVSQIGTNIAPNLVESYSGASITEYAAVAGQSIQIFTEGDVCSVTLGVGGCKAGQFLQPDANGNAVVASAGNYYACRSYQAGNQGEQVKVSVEIGKL